MNQNQEQTVSEAGTMLHKAFPDFHGSFRFNMKPERTDVNVNISDQVTVDIEQSKIIRKGNRCQRTQT